MGLNNYFRFYLDLIFAFSANKNFFTFIVTVIFLQILQTRVKWYYIYFILFCSHNFGVCLSFHLHRKQQRKRFNLVRHTSSGNIPKEYEKWRVGSEREKKTKERERRKRAQHISWNRVSLLNSVFPYWNIHSFYNIRIYRFKLRS